MNIKSLLDFLSEIEEMCKACNPEDMVRDSCGTYPKAQILSYMISDAKHLIKYGEYKIALENLLDNLAEYELKLDDETLEIAACAFGNNIKSRAGGSRQRPCPKSKQGFIVYSVGGVLRFTGFVYHTILAD